MRHSGLLLWLFWGGVAVIWAQDPGVLKSTAHLADLFQQKITDSIARESLYQRSFVIPPHGVITVGPAALDLSPRFMAHLVVSEYSVGHLKGSKPTDLLEFRELESMDGRAIQTPAVARKALSRDVSTGEDNIRKRILGEFTRLGLVDVATDYGLILLAFTTEGLSQLDVTPAGDAYVGTEETWRFQWTQRTGGALEFRGKKVARRPMSGSIWIRKRDGMPLRISASFEHEEPKHKLRDEASVDYIESVLGFPVPATVVHRHYIDDQAVTENLYSYEPFHLFTTDTNIRYSAIPPK